jgi:hypothetical protein
MTANPPDEFLNRAAECQQNGQGHARPRKQTYLTTKNTDEDYHGGRLIDPTVNHQVYGEEAD